MSPVVSVCPEHGPFASQTYIMRHVEGAMFQGAEDICPICGKVSRVIDGRFSFDGEGIATVISAPDWSREALRDVQGDLLAMANAAEDRRYSDTRAFALIDKRLEQMEQRAADSDEAQRALILGMKEEIERLRRKEPRSVLGSVLRSMWSVIGILATLSGAIIGTTELVSWAAGVIEAAQVVTVDDLPSEILAPGEGSAPAL